MNRSKLIEKGTSHVRLQQRTRGYFVSTVGVDEQTIREYIQNQEQNDRKSDQQRLF